MQDSKAEHHTVWPAQKPKPQISNHQVVELSPGFQDFYRFLSLRTQAKSNPKP